MNRLTKLRAMSARELYSRVAYEGFTAYERYGHRRGQLASPERLRRAVVPTIANRKDWRDGIAQCLARPRFFAGAESRDHMQALFTTRYADEMKKAREVAAQVAQGEISFFGRRFSCGSRIDWHADPLTGAAWPRTYHRDVPVHGGDIGFGDVKYVWEINRHQFFVDLAKVAFLDGSSSRADTLHRLLRDWMANVPPATGAPWACALEPAFRAWSWLWAYHLVRSVDMVSADDSLLWLTGFYDHGRFLYRHLETYASPYNHLIGEAATLFALGVLFPCFREANAWAARGRHVLESTLESQFHADGGSVEQSTFYHHATLGFYLFAAVLARRNGTELSADIWAAIERGIQFSATLVKPDGRLPRIGGADDGKPIRMEHLPFWDFRPYQAIGAVLFSRPDFKAVARRFWEDAAWLLGPDAVDAFDRLPSRQPPTTDALPASGYYVVRSDWSVDADYLCFDCGPQAAGLRRDDVPSAAHGHADCLSVIVALGGREVLVDPGFFCYNGDPQWEVGFRRTAVHNTITIDGQDQAKHVSKMAWIRTYAARPEGWAAEQPWARGSHDGYARIAGGVLHRRTAWLRPGGYVVIFDELTSDGSHAGEAIFQFARGDLVVNGARAAYDERFEMAWACSAPIEARSTCGGRDPTSGWLAPSLGVREAAPRLSLAFPIPAGRVGLLTVVADTHRSRVSHETLAVEYTPDRLLRARIAGHDFSDEIVAALEGAATTDDVESDAPMLVVRRMRSGFTEAFHAGGTYARVKAATLEPFSRPVGA